MTTCDCWACCWVMLEVCPMLDKAPNPYSKATPNPQLLQNKRTSTIQTEHPIHHKLDYCIMVLTHHSLFVCDRLQEIWILSNNISMQTPNHQFITIPRATQHIEQFYDSATLCSLHSIAHLASQAMTRIASLWFSPVQFSPKSFWT